MAEVTAVAVSYAGQEMRCPDPDCAELVLWATGEDPPEECPGCGTPLNWGAGDEEPVYLDELEERHDAR